MLKRLGYLAGLGTSWLLLGGMAAGAAIGHALPVAGQWLGEHMDATLMLLIVLLLFGVRFDVIVRALGNLRFIGIALALNFVVIPALGYAIASSFLHANPLFMVGLTIYFMAPCTDWFLGFTRLADGDVALGTALMPINMLVQLLLYPLYLYLVTYQVVPVESTLIVTTLLQWFLLPLAVAVVAHLVLRRWLGADRFAHLLAWSDRLTPWVVALLVAQIFADNIAVILEHSGVFGRVLLAVCVFFLATLLLGEWVSRRARLAYPEHALLTMTTAARNAPLMLAVTMTALPEQPLIHAAIVIGMLLEFPHLTLLRHLLLNSRHRLAGSRLHP
ncbi:Arsenite efflux pump ArsB, ACR3 family [Franzmannia pantelleriensis]|uniref:Arsenite efflux pump ArsB, ACR3 family n=1 Tax=Franzmannia pantelleriensis TaxID=48727 RepID=A0A1G9PDU3_9GAMM|nr:arsenic resistance protein [Halomonas pantelleriensis]SDL96315.1 Arsenite efflux pump ArsB, ACR3 family [Halomonas pantelleriensis]